MAYSNTNLCYTIVAGEDFTTSQYTGVNYAGAFGTTKDFEGVIQDKSKSGDYMTVCFFGITKARVGGTATAGQVVSVAASGYFTTAASGYPGVGRVITGAASGGLATVRLYGCPTIVASA